MPQLIIVHLMVVTFRNVLYHELLERGGGVAARPIVLVFLLRMAAVRP